MSRIQPSFDAVAYLRAPRRARIALPCLSVRDLEQRPLVRVLIPERLHDFPRDVGCTCRGKKDSNLLESPVPLRPQIVVRDQSQLVRFAQQVDRVNSVDDVLGSRFCRQRERTDQHGDEPETGDVAEPSCSVPSDDVAFGRELFPVDASNREHER